VPLPVKEFLSLSLFIIFSAYLAFTHDIAKVILGSFILPIFASAIFSNLKITRWMFWLSILTVLMLGVKMYLMGKLDSSMSMQIFVASFMFLCSYLLAKVLIRYGNDNIAALLDYDNQQRYMQEQLMLDPFTGLYNRKTFDEYLSRLMEECRSTQKQLALAMIDVDHFKRVNDFYGHAVGDQVLLHLSNILKENKAENIHVFRVGGEEFAVLFKDYDEKEAYRICDDMRKRMETASLRSIDKKRVTFSCGLVYMNSEILSPEAFTSAADTALYAAKSRGRNNIAIYAASFETTAIHGK
ncbi:MAG: GGDEF domain-containing protein, partial [Bacillota bacterium]